MWDVLRLNPVAPVGLSRFPSERYRVVEACPNPDAILLRSHALAESGIPSSVLVVARAGAGVNNIPVALCSARGIPVFNTPGGNANAVKELVAAALLLASRDIVAGIRYVDSLSAIQDPAALTAEVEGNKRRFRGGELAGKTLGVVGLGAVGSMAASIGMAFGMEVRGYDPDLSVETALRLPSDVRVVDDLISVVSVSDYVTLHVPLLDSTRNMVNASLLRRFRPGARLLNFSRIEVVDVDAVAQALDDGRISRYVVDFPHPAVQGRPNAIQLPHLGASTVEAEENCSVMAVEMIKDFLDNGNIRYSVNFPATHLERAGPGSRRLAVSNRNVPRMLNKITAILAERNINVIELVNKSRGEIAYNLIDVAGAPAAECLDRMREEEGVIRVRLLPAPA